MEKTDTIRKHRELWAWIADENERRMKIPDAEPADKSDYFEEHGIPPEKRPMHHCYACQYAHELLVRKQGGTPIAYKQCKYCPLDWTNNGEFEEKHCETDNNDGLFDQFTYAVQQYYIEDCAKIARTIAELPERIIEES